MHLFQINAQFLKAATNPPKNKYRPVLRLTQCYLSLIWQTSQLATVLHKPERSLL